MQRLFATFVFSLGLMALPQAPTALTEPSSGNRYPAELSQSQVFVSNVTSLVRQGGQAACVQSAGTDWKTNSTAMTADGQASVKLEALQSNTPFVSHIRPKDESGAFLRLAFGFSVSENTPEFETQGHHLIGIAYEIEARGDTLVIKDAKSVTRILAALRSDGGLRVSARSQKLMPSSPEHIVSHLFHLPADETGLRDCRNLAEKPAREPSGEVHIGLGAMAREDADIAHARAAACNRDINPSGAELVALSTLDGITLPLSHALLKRDSAGKIVAIWAGDLLRIERAGSTFQQRISNSVRAQGPLGLQAVPACTRMSAPSCVNVVENAQGRVSVSSCIEDLIALAAGPSSGYGTSQTNPLASIGRGVSGGRFGGGGGGSSSGSASTTDPVVTAGLASFPDDDTEFVLANHDPQRSGDDPDPETPNSGAPPSANEPNVVPLPAGIGLLVFALGLAFGASRKEGPARG